MIDNISASALSSFSPSIPNQDNPAKMHQAAQQFESLLIGQLLKTARESGGGWLGTDEDDAGQSGIEMGEQQLAGMLASAGGLGLSSLIEKGLKAEATKESSNGSA